MEPSEIEPRSTWVPELFGPLHGEPVITTQPPQLFAGEEKLLSRRQIARRVQLRVQVWSALSRIREEGEQMLYLAPADEIPPFLQQLGLGMSWLYYCKVALIFTDQRLVEILLGPRGRGLATRVRSFPWSQVRDLKIGLRGLTLSAAKGAKRSWRLTIRADKKTLKLLIPKLRDRVLAASAAAPRNLPLWHCPACGRATTSHPQSCDGCGTLFRTRGLASWLALAFPGAGLLYAGHPVLAIFDFLGEIILYGFVVMMALQASDAAEVLGTLFIGVILFGITKLESIHVSNILVGRTKPIARSRSGTWRQVAAAGTVLSLVAVALPFVFSGRNAPVIDRDLDLAAEGWSASRSRSSWLIDQDMVEKRCEWIGPDGEVVVVLAYALSSLESFEDFSRGFESEMESPAETVEINAFRALHTIPALTDEEGEPFSRVIYVLHDPEGHDVHLVMLDAEPEYAELADTTLRALLATGDWISASPPSD